MKNVAQVLFLLVEMFVAATLVSLGHTLVIQVQCPVRFALWEPTRSLLVDGGLVSAQSVPVVAQLVQKALRVQTIASQYRKSLPHTPYLSYF